MMKMLFGLLAAFAVLASQGASAEAWRDWTQGNLPEGQAIGRIWSVEDQAFVSPTDLIDDLKTARFVLAGEIHDNPVHHQLQAWIIDQVTADRAASVVMEMLSEDQKDALDSFMQLEARTPAGFSEAVEWDASGWPDFAIYAPVLAAALGRDLPILHGLPARADTRTVSQSGLSALGDPAIGRLRLGAPLPPDQQDALEAEIQTAHCDLLPVEALPNMAAVQIYRDGYLADALRRTRDDGPAILIAGNGHVRTDRGVPAFLTEADGRTVAIMMQETAADTTPEAAAGDMPADTPADYVWLTSRIERPDPCVSLRERFGKTAPKQSQSD